jgi:hypothetical protein
MPHLTTKTPNPHFQTTCLEARNFFQIFSTKKMYFHVILSPVLRVGLVDL